MIRIFWIYQISSFVNKGSFSEFLLFFIALNELFLHLFEAKVLFLVSEFFFTFFRVIITRVILILLIIVVPRFLIFSYIFAAPLL